jgi:hypothetical protein
MGEDARPEGLLGVDGGFFVGSDKLLETETEMEERNV